MRNLYGFYIMTKRAISKYILSTSVLVALFLMGYFVFMLLYPFKVVKFNKFELDKSVVKVGEEFCVNMSFVKYQDFYGEKRWLLVDHVHHELNKPAIDISRGVYKDKKACFYANVNPDNYRLRFEGRYYVIPGRTPIPIFAESGIIKVVP